MASFVGVSNKFPPNPRQLRSRDIFQLLPRSWPFIRPYLRNLSIMLVAVVPAAAFAVVGFMLLQIFMDVVGNGHPMTSAEAWLLGLQMDAARELILKRACIALGILVFTGAPLAMFGFGYAIWVLQKISNLFRVSLFDRLQHLSLGFHSDRKIGDAIFRMFQDTAAVPQVLGGLLIEPLRYLPIAMANLLWLAFFNYDMALVATLLIPAHLLLIWAFSDSLRRSFLEAREAAADATSRIEETLASIKTVKAFGAEQREHELYDADNWRAFVAARRARMLFVSYRVLANTLRGSGFIAMLYLGAHQVLTQSHGGLTGAAISLGLFESTLIAFGRITGGVSQLAVTWGNLQDVGVGLARVFEVLDQSSEHEVQSGSRLPLDAPHLLALDEVSFGYDWRSSVFNETSIQVHGGELTAVVGASGSGKTTLISLLLRFFDPTSGRITLDSFDNRDFQLAPYRALFSTVLQDNPLFTGTLRENLCYAKPDASEDEIADAIALASLTNFIATLPFGLETMLGEKGAKISVGQAQRIGLARALLRGAPILLLDEPTSALDIATEEAVIVGLRTWIAREPSSRMAIMMTHRRTAAAAADRVYRIESGKLEESAEFTAEISSAAAC